MMLDKAMRSEYHKLKARDLELNLQKLKKRMAMCQDGHMATCSGRTRAKSCVSCPSVRMFQ